MIDLTLKDLLFKGVCNIIFEKADGSQREMRCTLSGNLIPEHMIPKDKVGISEESEIPPTEEDIKKDSQAVFDLDIGQWRSFKWSKLKSYQQ